MFGLEQKQLVANLCAYGGSNHRDCKFGGHQLAKRER